MLAALDHPKVALEPYQTHLKEIQDMMRASRASSGVSRTAGARVSDLLAGRLGYDGDRLDYDNPRNADLISVIDRRRGLPVALGILYIHAARAAGHARRAASTPRAISCCASRSRGEQNDHRSLQWRRAVDPAHVPVELRPDDAGLAQLVSDTDVLLRLQNNLKLRALSAGDHARGLELTRRMVLIAPRRSDLWFDLARLNEALGVLGAARRAFETCLALAPPGEALHNEAAISLSQLKRRLN